jgi:hypothetical protein
VSRSTIALAVSAAMPRTLAIASSVLAAIVFSATPRRSCSSASSAFRRASDSAVRELRISCAIALALPRASPKDFS